MCATKKTERKAKSDLSKVLSPKSHMTAIEVYRETGGMEHLFREIKKPNGRDVYLTKDANASFLNLVDFLCKCLPSANVVGRNDIYTACKVIIGGLCEAGVKESDVQAFIDSVELEVLTKIESYKFYATLDGLRFDDFEELKVGRVTLQEPSLKVLQDSDAYEEMRESIWKRMGQALWISEEFVGSRELCQERFFESVKLICGLLSMSLAVGGEWGVIGRRLMPCIEGLARPAHSSWFSISTESNMLCSSSSSNFNRLQPVKKAVVVDLLERDWFNNLVRIIQGDAKTDLEQAVRRGVYWYFDAQLDGSLEMQLVKFWSCIECIFSFMNDGQTTKSIRNGMTGMFIGGGYQLVSIEDMASLRSDIRRLYKLRCGAVHDAKHSHVTERDVGTISKWAAWVMIEVAGLAAFGVKTRKEVKIQTDYLFQNLKKAS